MITISINPHDVKHGDTMICKDGEIRTVDRKYITNGFMGLCIYGYPYGNLKEQVKVIKFPVWKNGEIVSYA